MSKKSHHFLTLWPWPLTYDLEKLIRSGHYHYQCVNQIWEQSIPWFLSYHVNTIAGGGRLRRKTITSPDPSDTGDIIITDIGKSFQSTPVLVINFFLISENDLLIQCKPDISRLVGSMERYRDIIGSGIYRATAMSQNPGQVFQRVVSGDGAFVCLAANSAHRQRIPWHLSKFDVALQNRMVEFQTKAVCA